MKKSSYFPFFIFSLFYLLTASVYALPYNSVLRWVGGFLLLGLAIFAKMGKAGGMNFTFPKAYAYLLASLVPTLFGISGNGTIYSFGRIISLLVVVFGLHLYLRKHQWSRKDLENMMELYTFMAGIMVVLCILTPHYVREKFYGVYSNPNFTSTMAVFVTVSSFNFFFLLKGHIRRWLYLLLLGCGVYCVILTESRAGVGCIAVFFLCLPFVYGGFENFKLRFGQFFTLLIVLIVSWIIVRNFEIPAVSRLLSSVTDGEFAASSLGFTRGETWGDVIEIFQQKPLFGWGYGHVGYKTFEVMDYTYNWGMHSSYFVLLCETGIFGTILVISFFGKYFKDAVAIWKKSALEEKENRFVRFLFLTCFILLVNAYAESFLFSVGNPNSISFWLPFVLVYNYVSLAYKEKQISSAEEGAGR